MGEFGKYKAAIARNNHSMEVQELQAKIEQLEKEKAEITRLVQSLRNEFDLNSDCPQVDRQIELLEEALRGECE